MAKQPILSELEYFIKGATTICSLSPSALGHLVHCGLNLLQNLPASKEVVFEYFTAYFDASVAGYIQLCDKEPNASDPNESSICEIQSALEKLIVEGQHAWSPYISSWSLHTLGALSKKYNRFDNRDIGTTCNTWLGSSVMRCLLGLTVSCFERLNQIEETEFIECLLNTYMHNSPHFDWVIARLGSCFPRKIIDKILHNGLKVFASNKAFGQDSEISVISYLSYIQENDIKELIKSMLLKSLYENPSNGQPEISTIPYLLNLCGKSDIILQLCVTVFLEIYDKRFIPEITDQLKHWPSNFVSNEFLQTVASLVLHIKKGSTKILLNIARIAEDIVWAHDLLEIVLQEVFSLLTEERSSSILSDTLEPDSRKFLMQSCIHGLLIESQTAVRLIVFASHQSNQTYHNTISDLLKSSTQKEESKLSRNVATPEIEAIIRLMSNMNGTLEPISIAPGINFALQQLLINEGKYDPDIISKNLIVLANILTLIRLEKHHASASIHLKDIQITPHVSKCLPLLIEIVQRYLSKSMDRVTCFSSSSTKNDTNKIDEPLIKKLRTHEMYSDHIHTIFSILNILEIGKEDDMLSMNVCIKFAEVTVKYFFWCLAEIENDVIRLTGAERVINILSRLCTMRKYARTAALRELLEGALFTYGNLFGMQSESEFDAAIKPKKSIEKMLIKINQLHNNTPNNLRSILHAGVIGNGLKVPAKQSEEPKTDARNFLLFAIYACCKQEDNQSTIDGFSSVSLLLVEFISSDVMYNGLPWPDEEFNRITMERDLQIRRTFKNAPILWSILALVATYRPSLCFASVLLRAICASLLHQWRAKSVLQNQTVHNNPELFMETKKLLEVMALGQLLPIPFNYLHAVIEHFEPFEIAMVLKECVWNYMKENVPTPMSFSVASNGIHWRDVNASKPHPQLVDPLRHIMQRKLSKLGSLYHYMFVLPELNKILA